MGTLEEKRRELEDLLFMQSWIYNELRRVEDRIKTLSREILVEEKRVPKPLVVTEQKPVTFLAID